MLVLMKTLHLFGLMLGAGGGLANMMLAMEAKRAGGPNPVLAALRQRNAMMALIGVLLLWATGLWMWFANYGAAMLGVAFALKLLTAALILAILVAVRVAMARGEPGAPPPAFVRQTGPLSGVLAFLAVALSVYVFN